MNEQNFSERVNIFGNTVQTEHEADRPVVNSGSSMDEVPVLATLIYETPVGGSIPPVSPQDETIVQEAPLGQTIVYNQDSMGETLEHEAPIDETIPEIAAEVETNSKFPAPLLDPTESEYLRTRWIEIQGRFVDEPRSAVQQADALVSEVVEKITQMFANEHSSLESQWNQGKDVSTEDLRQTLQHYRAFFNRLTM
jgi:hypothetical protein